MECTKGTKIIPLTKGQYAIVDDEYYESLNKWKWHAKHRGNGNYVAVRTCYCIIANNKRFIYMHRMITSCPENKEVDHINHNTLDCRISNLRVCTRKENTRNNKSHKNSTSKYLGVYWNKRVKKWAVSIKNNGIKQFLGYYKNEIKAAKVYNQKAKQLFGEFANPNIV